MTNRTAARAFLHQATLVLEEARSLRHRGAWNLVVRRCQEAVELCLKAALRAGGGWRSLDCTTWGPPFAPTRRVFRIA